MRNYTKTEFINAYVWMFGSSKKKASELYKTADPEYIKTVINAYRKQNKLAFWND